MNKIESKRESSRKERGIDPETTFELQENLQSNILDKFATVSIEIKPKSPLEYKFCQSEIAEFQSRGSNKITVSTKVTKYEMI